MKYILRDKGHGKTHDLVQLSAKNNALIIVASTNRLDAVREEARRQGVIIPDPITYYKYLEGELYQYHHNYERVLLDDADDILRMIFGKTDIEAVAMTINNI